MKQSGKRESKRGRGRPLATNGLVVWGERRDPPDWDGYVKAVLDFAMAEVGRREPHIVQLAGALSAVAEQKHQDYFRS